MQLSFLKKHTFLIIALTVYVCLALMAVLFYKERVIFSDAACHYFIMLKTGTYFNPIQRFAVYIPQSFIYLPMKLGLQQRVIALSYSLSFVLFQLGVFLFLYARNLKFAQAWLLFNVLMVAHSFYWMASEMPLGVGVMLVMLAVWERKWALLQQADNLQKGWLLLYTLCMCFVLQFFHPLIPLFFLLYTSFALLSAADKPSRWAYMGLPILFFAVAQARTLLIGISDYDAGSASNLSKLITLFPNYWDLPSNRLFLQFCLRDYYLLPVLLLLMAAFYLYTQKYLKLLWLCGAFFGYLLIVNVSYSHVQAYEQYYVENLYLPLSFVLILPFVSDLLPRLKSTQVWVVLALFAGIRLAHIYQRHEAYTQRLQTLRQLIADTRHDAQRKLVVPADAIDLQVFRVTWATPFEFWILSALEEAEQRQIVVEDNFIRNLSQYEAQLQLTHAFLRNDGKAEPYQDFPATYFSFQDTSAYRVYRPNR